MLRILIWVILAGLLLTGCNTATTAPPATNTAKLTMTVYKDAT